MRLPLSLLLAAVLAGCEAPHAAAPDSAEAVAEQLAGTWLRDEAVDGVRVRRLLRLEAGGRFEEEVLVTDAQGAPSGHRHEGTWLYDGTNLKRKYTLVDGRPPSRLRVPFVTFAIAFGSRNEFDGVDHVHGRTVHYRRVAPGTSL